MSTPDLEHEKARLELELRIERQIAFASGIFQSDVTIRTLLESLVEGVIIIDKSKTILLVNARAEEMFGYSREELIGKPHAILIPEGFRKAHEAYEAHFFQEPKIRPMGKLPDFAGLRRDGSEFPVEISLNFIQSINGILVLAFINDITLRKEYESSLQESEELSRILGVVEYAIFILDPEGNIRSWTAGAERLNGYRSDEVTGRHFSCFYPEEDRTGGKSADKLRTAAADGRAEDEGWMIRKDGSRYWADVIITAIRDENGTLRGFSNVTRDITERKRTEEVLRETEQKLRSIVEHSTNLFYVHNTDHVLTYVSPQSWQFFDCEPEEAMVRWPELITDNPANSIAIEATQRAIDTGEKQPPYQVECSGKKDRKIWVEVNEKPLVENGVTVAIFGSLTDITDHKRVEDALRESEERFRLMADAAPVMIWMSDTDSLCTFFNKTWLAFTGRSLEQEQGNGWNEGVHPDDRPDCLNIYHSAFNARRDFQTEYRLRRADGEYRWLFDTGVPRFKPNGDFAGFIGSCFDISERKRAEKELRESESNLKKSQSLARMGSWVYGFDNRISWSDEMYQIYGVSPDTFTPTVEAFINLIHPNDRSAMQAWIAACVADKNPGELEFRIVWPDNSIHFINGRGELVPEAMGLSAHMAGTAIDITERKRVEEEIERLNADLTARAGELEAANLELEAFNYTVAHDLRKPLTVVNGYCQALMEICSDNLDAECNSFLKEAYDGTLRMNRLIDALLDFSRLTHAEPKCEPVNLCGICEEIASELKQAEPERQVSFRIPSSIVAEADPILLRAVLSNFFGNAWKYTSDCDEGVIEFSATEIDGKRAYFVRDNGLGFDPAEAGKLFAPFQRLETGKEIGGLGIGLYTVARIIHSHGGQVWAEGEPGKGATFYFTLGDGSSITKSPY